MTAEIIAVGTELLLGDIVNTNAQFLSQKLSELGINTYYQTVVGDNEARLRAAILLSLSRADILILSGGLGPTDDDITKEVAAAVMGKELYLDAKSLRNMEEYFTKAGKAMPETNKKQAYIPEGAIILQNDFGTAPGCIIESEGKIVICLPGPPREIAPMFNRSVYPYLAKQSDSVIHSKVLRIFGIGESTVSEMVSDFIKNSVNPTVAPYAKEGEVTLRLTAKAESAKEAISLINQTETSLRSILGDYVYNTNDDTLDKTVVGLLKSKFLTLSTAESCTGGLLSGAITSVSGASAVFCYGFITYSNDAKMKQLGVSEETLSAHGAVSSEVATQMARGALISSGSDIAISITGIAGPDGGSEDKPVGLVYIGYADKETAASYKLQIKGDRDRIRTLSVLNALDIIRRHIM